MKLFELVFFLVAIGISSADDLGPDLEINRKRLMRETYITDTPVKDCECAFEEGCLDVGPDIEQDKIKWPKRKLCRFTLASDNVGWADFMPKVDRSQWKLHKCHRHMHGIEYFAGYTLYYLNETVAVKSLKASFCLEDSYCLKPFKKFYQNCNTTQGISRKCTDVYTSDLDCQWIEITKIPYGIYILKVIINPEETGLKETNRKNNCVRCTFNYKESYPISSSPKSPIYIPDMITDCQYCQ